MDDTAKGEPKWDKSWGGLAPEQAERAAGQLIAMAGRVSGHGYKTSESYAEAMGELAWTTGDLEKIGHPVGGGFIRDTMAYDRVCVDMERMGLLSGDGAGSYKTLPAGAALAAKWEATLPAAAPPAPPEPGMIQKLGSWLGSRREAQAEQAASAPARPGVKQ